MLNILHIIDIIIILYDITLSSYHSISLYFTLWKTVSGVFSHASIVAVWITMSVCQSLLFNPDWNISTIGWMSITFSSYTHGPQQMTDANAIQMIISKCWHDNTQNQYGGHGKHTPPVHMLICPWTWYLTPNSSHCCANGVWMCVNG